MWPREVEGVLLQHPSVSEAAVVGIEDPDSGEAVKAFVVLKRRAAHEPEIIDYARARIADYKAPRFVEFIDTCRAIRGEDTQARAPGARENEEQ